MMKIAVRGGPSDGVEAPHEWSNDRPRAMFIAGSRGLDFLNSIATPVDKPIEFINSGEHFLQWLRDAQLVRPRFWPRCADRAVPGELDDVAAQARAIREWFREFVDEYRGKPLPAKAVKKLESLNQVLARDEEFGQIVSRDHKHSDEAPSDLKWEVQRRWRSPEALLIPIAKAMAELVCSEDFSDIKACEGRALYAFLPRQDPSARPTLVQYGHLRKSRQTGCTQKENEADARSTVAEMIV